MVAKWLLPGILVLAFLSNLPAAEEKKPARALSVYVGRTIRVQMANQQIIRRVVIDREGIVKVVPAFDDPRTLLITGLAPGKARIVITGEDGKQMAIQVGQ